jgi:histidinol-phosphate aminotransferase
MMVSADSLPIRDDLRGQQPYGAPQIDVPVRLNTNENPFSPSSAVVDSVTRRVAVAAATVNRYPDRDARELRMRLARYVGRSTGCTVSAESLWAANGSNEVLQQLLQTFGGPGRRALAFEPTYSMHRLICRGTGTEYVSARRSAEFALTSSVAIAGVTAHRPDLVFLCSPNNPTGEAIDPDVIADIYDATEAVVVVDEAYGEFSNRPSAITVLPNRPRLVVVRTMSKAFALAGARVGYAVGDPGVIDALQLVRLPYHLSSLTQATALAALDHTDELLSYVESLKQQRDRIGDELRALGYRVAASDANFVLFGGLDDQAAVWQQLIDRGVLIRDVRLTGYLRVTAGTPHETDEFLKAIRAITEGNVA